LHSGILFASPEVIHRPRSDLPVSEMVIPLNPEGMGIGEWVILFSENFEGMAMGMGMGNSKKLCA